MNSIELEKLYSQLGDGAKQWVIEHQKKIYSSVTVWGMCLVVSLLVPFIVFISGANEINASQWFQRSGTFVLVFSLLSEIKVQEAKSLILIIDANYLGCHRFIEDKNKKIVPYIQYTTYLLVVIGTLITGYGDLFYTELFTNIKS